MSDQAPTESVSIENLNLRLGAILSFADDHLKKSKSVFLGAQHINQELQDIALGLSKMIPEAGVINVWHGKDKEDKGGDSK